MTKNESQLIGRWTGFIKPFWCLPLLLIITASIVATKSDGIEAAKLTKYKNHRMGDISPPPVAAVSQAQQLDSAESLLTGSPVALGSTTSSTTTSTTTISTPTAAPAETSETTAPTKSVANWQPDIIINSIEDELTGKWATSSAAQLSNQAGQLSNRHRYEQSVGLTGNGAQTTDTMEGQQQQQLVSGRLDGDQQRQQQLVQEQTEPQSVKIEARNQADSPFEQQQQQQETLIVDHRPSGTGQTLNENQQQQQQQQLSTNEYVSSTQSPLVYTSTVPTISPSSSSSTTTAATTTTASSLGSAGYTNQASTIGSTQMVPQWLASSSTSPSGQQQFYFATSQTQPATSVNTNQQQQQQQQQPMFGSMMSASNQVANVQQHPTSINSIISEQQQQQQASTSALGAQAQAQMMAPTMNGQPASLILVGQPQTGSAGGAPGAPGSVTNLNGMPQQQLIGIGQNGRRVSISNWLRGIGSMLANIFNRREHGTAGSGGIALLQPTMMASNANGIAVLAPTSLTGAAGSSPSSPSTITSTGSGGNWIQLGPNAPHWLTQAQSALQQFQQQHHQLGASSSRFATFIQAPQQQQQQQQQQVAIAQPQMNSQQQASGNYQQMSGQDLQASGSSHNIVSVHPPASTSLATNQQPYQSGTIVFAQLGSQSPLSSQPLAPVQQQQQQQQSPAKQQQQQQQQQQANPSSQTQQARPSSSAQTGDVHQTTNSNLRNQIAASGPPTNHAARLGRSSSGSNAASKKQQRLGAQNNSNGNLPLAHYSQYAVSD